MILLTLLLITLLSLLALITFGVSIGGAVVIVLFGDVIICLYLLIKIIKRLFRKKK